MRIVLAQPRGFCAGVVRAIETVERALEREGAPVYVRHEIVHNRHVVDRLRRRGARFVAELDEVPDGALTIFSAHGVAAAVEEEARVRRLPVLDATCPLVAKVHHEVRRYEEQGRSIILIGHAGHPEVEGTLGRIAGVSHIVASVADVEALPLARDTPLAYVTQTTLSVDDTRGIISALAARFDDIVGPDTRDICYATQNRQVAVRALAAVADVILVVGARYSSNSNRLREIGDECGVPSYLIEEASEIDERWLAGVDVVGVTAGASAPEVLVQGVITALAHRGPVDVSVLGGIEENVRFRLPEPLDEASAVSVDATAAYVGGDRDLVRPRQANGIGAVSATKRRRF